MEEVYFILCRKLFHLFLNQIIFKIGCLIHVLILKGKKNNVPSTSLGSVTERPPPPWPKKKKDSQQKNKLKLNNMYTYCLHGWYPGKLSKLPEMTEVAMVNTTSSSKHKRAVGGGGQLWEVISKWTMKKGKAVKQMWLDAFTLDQFLMIYSHLLSGTEDRFTNGDFLYECKFLLEKANF